MAKSAVDAIIKFKGKFITRSFLKTPFSEFQLGVGFGPHKTLFLASQIHTNSPQSLDDALNLFNKMKQTRPLPSVFEFNKILCCVNTAGHYSASVDIFKQLCSLGVSVDVHTLKALVFSCCYSHRTNDAFAALAWNLKRAGPNIHDVHTFTHLLDGLFVEHKFGKAQEFFNNLVKHNLCQPDSSMYSVMIAGLCCSHFKYTDKWASERLDAALKLFNEMGSISPDHFTYKSLLLCLCRHSRWPEASMMLKESLDKGFSLDDETFSILLQFLAKEGKTYESDLVLDMMHEKAIVPCSAFLNALVKAHCLHMDITKARYFFDLMLERDLAPSIGTCKTLIETCCNHHLLDEAIPFYNQMIEKGFKLTESLFNTMINRLFLAGRPVDGYKVLDDMRVQGHMLDSLSYARILTTLCNMDRLEDALSLFHSMGDTKLNSYSFVYFNLIDGAIKCGNINVAREVFSAMCVQGLKPIGHIYTLFFRAFIKEGLLNDVKKLFIEMQESGCESDYFTYDLILKGYLQNNQYNDVAMILHSMDGTGYKLGYVTTSLLRDAIAAGSLDPTMSNLINKLAPKHDMDIPDFAA